MFFCLGSNVGLGLMEMVSKVFQMGNKGILEVDWELVGLGEKMSQNGKFKEIGFGGEKFGKGNCVGSHEALNENNKHYI